MCKEPTMAELPTGTVTSLFTDVEGSAAYRQHRPKRRQARLDHDQAPPTESPSAAATWSRPRARGHD
jgi:hypothetical protein